MSKIHYLTSILIICFWHNTYCQFLYTKQGDARNNFVNVFEVPNTKDLLITCVNFSLNVANNYVNSHTSILKVNSNGLMLDSFNVSQNFITAGKMLYHNNFYYIYGFESSSNKLNDRYIYPTILKFDSNFNELKKLRLDSVYINTVSSIQNTVIINNQLYLAYYYGQTPIAKLFKLSLNLNIKDSLTMQAYTLLSMIKQGDNLLISGGGFPNSSGLGRAQVAKIDTNFTVINRFNLDSITTFSLQNCTSTLGIWPQNCNLVEISDKSYFVSGFASNFNSACNSLEDDVLYGIIQNNQQVIKGKQYGTPGNVRESEQNFTTMAGRQGQYIYKTCISGITPGIISQTSYTTTNILTAKIDTSGNLIWQKYFNTPNYYYQPMAMCVTEDSGIVITGMRYDILLPQFINAFEGFVMKIDKNGNQVFVNIHENNKPHTEFLMYPNPTANETHISLNCESAETATILITDMLGNMVQQDSKALVLGSNSMTINTSQLSNGIYNLTVSSKNGRVTKKLSVTK